MTKFTMGFEYEAAFKGWDEEDKMVGWFRSVSGPGAYTHEDGDGMEFSTEVFSSFEDCIAFAEEFLGKVRPLLRKPYGTGSGIHVHISQDAFTNDQIAKLVYWMNGRMGHIFTRMSGRDPSWPWFYNASPNNMHLECARAHLLGYEHYTNLEMSGQSGPQRIRVISGSGLNILRDGMLCRGSGHPTYEQRMYWSSPDLLLPAIQQLHCFARIAEGGDLDKDKPFETLNAAWFNITRDYKELNDHYRGYLRYGKKTAPEPSDDPDW